MSDLSAGKPSPASMKIGIVGAGIVGLAVARAIQERRPGVQVVIFEKEFEVAHHQTGRNSGVIHAGLYYTPGSLKARLCVEGVRKLRQYCREKGIAVDECGKLVVALEDKESLRLKAIHERAVANGVPDVALLEPAAFREIEPHLVGKLALHSPHTAIVDFGEVARSLAADVQEAGATIYLGAPVEAIRQDAPSQRLRVRTPLGVEELDALITCAGLQADTVAGLVGDDPAPRIVPFRGEYRKLTGPSRELVRGLIYPVPDPRYPFLGVHLTKRIDGEMLIGPNAVLAMAREGYDWKTWSIRDLAMTASWPGMWRLGARHWRTGISEVLRSFSKKRFVEAARRYVPELAPQDVVPAQAGVRAQALDRDGSLVDDFRISFRGRVVNVRNAPSPAATSSLAIGEYVAREFFAGLDP